MKLPYKWGIQSIHGFEDFYHEFLQVVNMYAIVSISGKKCFRRTKCSNRHALHAAHKVIHGLLIRNSFIRNEN